jgi:squalene-hopene/tetraprenyl-beta-curcumene cyclase
VSASAPLVVNNTELSQGIAGALQWLDQQQKKEGFWVGILESNCCIEAEWLLAFYILGHEFPDTDGLIRGILSKQRADGAWETYFDAPSGDINATVECYAALRVHGLSPDDEPLVKARAWILAHGGLQKLRVFTRYWLALIGEWPWEATPNLPPEVIRFPLWFPFNIYHFACWARATLLPLAVLSARRHVRHLPLDLRMDELFPGGRARFDFSLPERGGRFSWFGFFSVTDRLLHKLQDLGLTPGRRGAVRRCLEWIIRHQDADGAWGGIQPPWIYSLMALNAEGYSLSHPVMSKGLSTLQDQWSYQRPGGLHIQASESPVWDTMLSLMAMLDCGREIGTTVSMQAATSWLLQQEIRSHGDWAVKVKGVEPGGWAFERANAHYPDVDDTAVAIAVLARLRRQLADSVEIGAAIDRGTGWMLAMQSDNGGWASFDKNNDRKLLTRIPFSDFGETIDPPSADVTAHVLEALAELGCKRTDPVVARGLEFLKQEQEARGSWFGRWGVNHIYGTAAVLVALKAIAENMSAPYVCCAAEWLVSVQNDDGGWGESCASYMDETQIGCGKSTASQTGWAMMGLLAVSPVDYQPALARGSAYLLATQSKGTWDEPEYTGTGFPGYGSGARIGIEDPDLSRQLQQGPELQRAFMINYNLYRHYFPLAALGRYQSSLTG